MPSPIGHSLASLIVGRPASRGLAVVLIAVGLAPDLDLLWGRHSMETHSIGAALAAGLVAMLCTRNARLAAVIAAVWFAHPLLDCLGADDSAPRGVMLLWPFSREYFVAPIPIFDAISRMWWRDDVWSHNFKAAAKEVLILGPILAAAWIWRRRALRK